MQQSFDLLACGVKRYVNNNASKNEAVSNSWKKRSSGYNPTKTYQPTRFTPMRFPTVTNLTTLLTVLKLCCIKAPKNFHHFHVFPDSSTPKKGMPASLSKGPWNGVGVGVLRATSDLSKLTGLSFRGIHISWER